MLIVRKDLKKIFVASTFVLMAVIVAAQDNTDAGDTLIVNNAPLNAVVVSGSITNSVTKTGLAGIRVLVEDFSATLTDAQGNFSLRVPSYTSTVTVEGEGFETRRLGLKGQSTIKVALMDEDHESFHEKVTMPFGLKNKSDVTASVSRYNVNAAWTQPSEVADAMLQGRIPGLHAIRRSGSPGVGANLFLRGFNSLYGTNKPLIIVDNMLFDANDYGQSIIANNYTNPLALIDVKDIDNITVLKDASGIYGTKGANGVILITTARAKSQATRIDFAAYTGFNRAPKSLPVMGAGDYRIYLSEMLQSSGMNSSDIAALPYMNDDRENPAYAIYHYNTDWQKKIFSNSINQNYFLKITGGDNIATYGLSMGYTGNKGVVRETSLTRYNTRFNAEFNFTKRFTGVANLSFTYNEQNLKDQGISDKTAPLYLSLIKAPFLSDRDVNAEGIESPNISDRDTLGISNPSAMIKNMQAYNRYYRFFGSFGFNYQISEHLKASSLFGVVYDKVRENIFVPRKGVAEDTLANAIADSRMGTQVKRLFTIYNDTRIEFSRKYNHIHGLAARAGIRYQQNKAEQDFAMSYNSATDDLVSVQNGLNGLRLVGGGTGEWNWVNFYISSEYGYKDKLFFTFNAAMDGSSRFGKQGKNGLGIGGNRFALMPSVGAAWLISSENFMAHSVIDLLKLRVTYSITGNDDIGNYNSLQTYTSQNLLGAQGLVRNGIANPALQWETNRKINGGFDIAFWNERVNLSIDAYQSKTGNMLVYQPLTTATGFESVLTNGGEMKNTGLEAAVNIRLVNTLNFKWDAGINASTYKNEILAVPNNRFTTEYAGSTVITSVGNPAAQFYGYTTDGVFATDAEAAGLSKRNADGSVSQFKGGDIRFIDRDFNKIIDLDDRSIIGNPNPSFIGGFSNRLSWKNFQLHALFTWSQGNDVYNYIRYRLESSSGVENQLISVNNRWRAQGQVTNTPKMAWGDPMGNSRFSDRWIEDGSYFRLRSLSLEYNWPIKPDGFLKSTSIYIITNNLFTLTRYKGYDPEFSVTPGVFSQGIDTGLDPQFRNVTLGVRLGL